MHMADALLSPAVGGAFWAASAAVAGRAARRLKHEGNGAQVPLMGTLGAFVFAAQMLNFAIPGTGSSGHLGGGLLLAILVGSDAAFLVMASILAVQALFFADGGLLALGCNLFNLGFLPAYVAYPLVYRPLAGRSIPVAAFLAALLGLEMGAAVVALQTTLSGLSALPFKPFLGVMLSIHLPIGAVEGLATGALVAFLSRAEPGLATLRPRPGRGWMAGFLAVTLLLAGGLSWMASRNPDGLEWSVARILRATGGHEPARTSPVHTALAGAQSRTAVLPDYAFRTGESRAGTSLSGLLGSLLTVGLVAGTAWLLRRRRPAAD